MSRSCRLRRERSVRIGSAQVHVHVGTRLGASCSQRNRWCTVQHTESHHIASTEEREKAHRQPRRMQRDREGGGRRRAPWRRTNNAVSCVMWPESPSAAWHDVSNSTSRHDANPRGVSPLVLPSGRYSGHRPVLDPNPHGGFSLLATQAASESLDTPRVRLRASELPEPHGNPANGEVQLDPCQMDFAKGKCLDWHSRIGPTQKAHTLGPHRQTRVTNT